MRALVFALLLVSCAGPRARLSSLDGRPVALPAHRTLLTFCASWCEACHATLAQVATLRGAEVVAVSIDSSAEAAKRIDTHGLPVLLDRDGELAADLGVSKLPGLVLLRGDGSVEARGDAAVRALSP